MRRKPVNRKPVSVEEVIKEVEGEEEMFSDVFFNIPGVIRFEECDPAQVLGQITQDETLAPTCPQCGQVLPQEGNTFKKCPCHS